MDEMNNMENRQRIPHAPDDKYVGLLLSVYENRALTELLKLISALAVLYSVFVLGITLAASTLLEAVKIAVVLVVPFAAVTVFRYLVDAPRPYELMQIFQSAPKKKKGKSFPSRHVFSAFLIGTVALPTIPIFAAILLIFAALLGVCRVLLGIHFVRDVVAGAVLGIVSGGVGLLLLSLT